MIILIIGEGQAEGRAEMKNLLGGKEAKLAEMTSTGLPVTTGMGSTMYLVFPVQKYFSIELLAGYAINSTQKRKSPAPLIDIRDREKHQERRKGNGSTFEAT